MRIDKILRSFAALLLLCALANVVRAQTATAPGTPANTAQASPMEKAMTAGSGDQSDSATFEKIKGLAGEWATPLDNGEQMINIFTPFAYGTKVFAQEWENGKYITSTIFYMVGSELRADHFCDFKNEPRYTVKSDTVDPKVLHFEFRDATSLEAYPMHFHSTTWHLVDKDHLVQDWYIQGGDKPEPPAHMEFTRKKLALRADGTPTPA